MLWTTWNSIANQFNFILHKIIDGLNFIVKLII